MSTARRACRRSIRNQAHVLLPSWRTLLTAPVARFCSTLPSMADEMARLLSGSGGESSLLLMERFGLLNLPARNTSGVQSGLVGVLEAGGPGDKRSAAFRHEWGPWAGGHSTPPQAG